MAENKTKPTSASVDDFIAAIENPRRRAEALVSLAIYKEVTGLQPVMWGPSIIGFGTCHYKYDSGREGDMPVAGFSPRKPATVIYIATGARGSEALFAKLGTHTIGKSCLYIKKLADVDQAVLKTLVVKSIAEIRSRYPS